MTFLRFHLPAAAVSLLYILSFSLSHSLSLSVSQSVRPSVCVSAPPTTLPESCAAAAIRLSSAARTLARARIRHTTGRGICGNPSAVVSHVYIYIYERPLYVYRGSGHDDPTPADSLAGHCEKCRARTVSIGSDSADEKNRTQ